MAGNYYIMQNRRYMKNIRAFKKIVDDGVIGKSGFICADFFLGPHFGGFRDIMASPLILDMAIHTFDQARFISGQDAVSVYCHEFNTAGSWYHGNAAAVWDGDNAPYYETVVPAGKQKFTSKLVRVDPPVTWDGRDGHAGCLDEMFAALKQGRRAETDCTDNIKSMAMVFGAIQSAREGRKVSIF